MKADLVFYNGEVLAMDGDWPGAEIHPRDSVAVADGAVVFPGDDGWKALCGPSTEAVDLKGGAVIPGLVDAHLHPLWGARTISGNSLGYEPLGVEATLDRLRGLLAKDPGGPDELMTVRCWERHGGADLTSDDLEMLGTQRPVVLFSGDCHTAVLNRRAMFIYREFTEGGACLGGRSLVGPSGPSGVLEDGPAMRLNDELSRAELRATAETLRKGLKALNSQGVTSVMDARATVDALNAAQLLWEYDDLTVRYSGAWEILPSDCPSPVAAMGAVSDAYRRLRRFRRGLESPEPGHGGWRPGIRMSHLKFFVDGMPGYGTARLRTPYLAVRDGTGGTSAVPVGDGRGNAYFDAATLSALFLAAGEHGLHPHCHAIADGALDLVLDASAAMRRRFPDVDLRPAAAHLDMVAEDQYARMRELGVAAVLSFQWAGYTPEHVGEALAMFGPERMPGLETHGRFLDAGVVAAYGSDWPVECLDQWGNFQAGATRRMSGVPEGLSPRLGNDRDLTLMEILYAATRASAWVLGMEATVGRLAEGLPADLAVIEGPLLSRDPVAIKDTRVKRTLVGGRTVWRAE